MEEEIFTITVTQADLLNLLCYWPIWYILIALVVMRPFYYITKRTTCDEHDEKFFAIIMSVFWPLASICVIGYNVLYFLVWLLDKTILRD